MASNLKKSLRSLPIVKQTVQTKVVVVAIDFGTTYSSYAFSFYSNFLEDPLKINAPIWPKSKQQGVVQGTPTCALFTPEQTFHSFGYDAEEKYSDLAINSQHHDWYYFRHFKMLLYENQDLTVRLELKDDKGNSMPAIEVFSKSIEYLKNRFLTEFEKLQESKPGKVKQEEIYWVLTVPAIWDERAKRFMREAAINAGINTDHLSIALEPEAASLYCRYIPVQRIGDVGDSIVEIKSFVPGDRYVILDAGGGTIDIALHEIQDDETIKELHVANGGRWGGTSIDKKFESLLNDIIGADTMEILSFRCKDDFMDLMYNFEVKKRSLTPETSQKVTIRIPMSVFETYKGLNKVDLSQGEHLQPYLQGRVTFEKDKIRVDAEIMKGLYGETCEHIVNHMKEIFDKRELQDVNKILMVGGFSESKFLQYEMRKAFQNKTFIIPEEAGLAVVKGAVLFGHCPTMVKSRVCRFTYGIEAIRNFQPGLDRPERKIVKKYGKTNYFLCEKSFSIHAYCGESIDVGESRGKHEYVPSEVGEKKMTVSVYRSERRMPVYTDEPLCEKVGDVEVILEDQDNGIDRPVTVEMIFGDTELKVELVEKKTASVLDTYKEFNGEDLRLGRCLQSHLKRYVKFEGDKIRVDAYIIKGLYDDTSEHIVSHMNAIFKEYEVRNVSKVLMVGGFSESKLLQHEMKNAFPSKTFIIPEEAGQAVLKGAVMYGHCPTLIKSRVCRFTYGIEAYRDFQPGLDSPERKVVKKIGDTNYFLCEKSFSVHASRGESIDVGESRGKHEYVPSEPGIEKMKVSVYRSSDRMPVYIDEESCQKLGDVDVVLENTDNRSDRPVTVEMIFGDTELKVQLVEKNTGKIKKATFDCLKRDAHS